MDVATFRSKYSEIIKEMKEEAGGAENTTIDILVELHAKELHKKSGNLHSGCSELIEMFEDVLEYRKENKNPIYN